MAVNIFISKHLSEPDWKNIFTGLNPKLEFR